MTLLAKYKNKLVSSDCAKLLGDIEQVVRELEETSDKLSLIVRGGDSEYITASKAFQRRGGIQLAIDKLGVR